jgi:hypothetical protein
MLYNDQYVYDDYVIQYTDYESWNKLLYEKIK